jgi:hypothetical protein
MRESRSLLLMLIVLGLAMVIPMAASADLDSATAIPTPAMATATPTIGDDITADGASGYPAGLPNAQVPEGGPDPQAMEDFRNEFLSLLEVLDEICEELFPSARLSGKQHLTIVSPEVAQQLIQVLTHEELYILRQAFDDADYRAFKDALQALDSAVSTWQRESGEGEEGPGASLNSFTVIPTPTPTGRGIQHVVPFPIDKQSTYDINITTGDIFVKEGGPQIPGYPTDVLPPCPKDRFSVMIRYPMKELLDLIEKAVEVADISCEVTVVICPLPGGTNVWGCVAKTVVQVALQVGKGILNYLEWCNGSINSAEIEGTFNNTQVLHADLDDHDQYLQARADAIDRFLFDFRNLNLRARIEANLASPEDDPVSLFALPGNICIKDDPQPGGFNVEIMGDPNDPLTPERLRRCGLLEVVSDTVRSAIDLTSLAGQDVHNAEAEFDAAVEHYNNQEWKLAYARFRKAFREAVKP